jgi:hypothetical protein
VKAQAISILFYIGYPLKTSKAQTAAMFLVALCKISAFKKHGFNRIAEVTNNKLAVLETEGIIVEGYSDRIYGALAFIAGDNLNIHKLGGFNACFSPNVRYPCRFCMISNIALQEADNADSLELQTKQNYDAQACEVAQDGSKSQL